MPTLSELRPGAHIEKDKDYKTILVIEDDKSIRELLSIIFTGELDCNVVTASNLREAKSALQDQTPNLVITDWNMPDGSGDEIVALLKGNSQTADIPIIVLSAMPPNDIKDRAINTHVGKPFEIEDLLKATKKLLTQPAVA